MAKKVSIPGCSIWPQPKTNPRRKYKVTWDCKIQGRRRTESVSVDLAITVEWAQKTVAKNERIKAGLITGAEVRREQAQQIPLLSHLAEYIAHLKRQNKSASFVGQVARCVPLVLKKAGAELYGDLSPSRLQAALDDIKDHGTGLRVGTAKTPTTRHSPSTANHYRNLLMHFINWGVDERWPYNPLKSVKQYSVAGQEKKRRRAIEVEQFRTLLEKTKAMKPRRGMTGEQRASLYAVAVLTGLRANELRQVPVSSFVLTGPNPHVFVDAKIAKSRTDQTIALTPSQAAFIQSIMVGTDPSAPAFFVPINQAEILRADLKEAGIPYRVDGKDLDFHALRGLGGSWMISSGVDLKTVQERMRHASLATTVRSYIHPVGDTAKRGAASLPSFDDASENPRSATQSAQPSKMSLDSSPNVQGDGEIVALLGEKGRSRGDGGTGKQGSLALIRRKRIARNPLALPGIAYATKAGAAQTQAQPNRTGASTNADGVPVCLEWMEKKEAAGDVGMRKEGGVL